MCAISPAIAPSTSGVAALFSTSARETDVVARSYGGQASLGRNDYMLRTIFMIGLFAIGGLFVLKIAFGLFGFALAIFGVLLALAIKMLIVGALIYLVIRIFSPDTARRLRDKWSGY